MAEIPVELIKPRGNGLEKRNTFKMDTPFDTAPVGGIEGKKYYTSIVNPRYRKDRNDVGQKYKFISKEYPINQKGKVIEIIQGYTYFVRKDILFHQRQDISKMTGNYIF